MPAAQLALFEQNLSYARDMTATAVALASQVAPVLNTDDLLRAALVQGVSAFDHYVHEEVRVRMLEIQDGTRPRTPAFERFRVSMQAVREFETSGGLDWFDGEIREQHGFLSFQHPDKVADAFRLVTGAELWNSIAAAVGRATGDVKRDLILIVDRRNKIAHEADTNPTPPQERFPITEPLVSTSLDFLQYVVGAIQMIP